MRRNTNTLGDPIVLEAALEGLELQKQRIEVQIKEIRSRLGKRTRNGADTASPAAKKRTLSPDARKRIASAQKKRWAEYRKSHASSK